MQLERDSQGNMKAAGPLGRILMGSSQGKVWQSLTRGWVKSGQFFEGDDCRNGLNSLCSEDVEFERDNGFDLATTKSNRKHQRSRRVPSNWLPFNINSGGAFNGTGTEKGRNLMLEQTSFTSDHVVRIVFSGSFGA